jgi:hypothetical protein
MRYAAILTVVALTSACSGKPAPPPAPVAVATPVPTPAPPAVGAVTLGAALNADKTVATPVELFTVKDTIYASVATTGAGHLKLRSLWTFVKGDKTAKVYENTIEFDATGPANNEFHVANGKGWPRGEYRLEIFLGDSTTPSVTKTFKVL